MSGAVLVPTGVPRAALRGRRPRRSEGWLRRALRAAWAAWRQRRAERLAWESFRRLDDATLRDLGLDRGDLASLARGPVHDLRRSGCH